MPEDAKLKDIRERITDVAINERNGLRIILMGVFLFCLGEVFDATLNSFVFFAGISVSVLGIASTLFGFYVSVHYAHQYNNLLEELEHPV